MTQLTLDLRHPAAFGRADFMVSAGNAAALAAVERWPNWPQRVLVLHGPAGSGKTHLAHIWRERAAARIVPGGALAEAGSGDWREDGAPALAVDDAEEAPEEALLHLYNACRERGVGLLLTCRAAPSSWPIALPDLASRLRAAWAVGIEPPDDDLLGAVLVKHFADRQLVVRPEVVRYLLRRMERSLAAAADVAAALDRLALSRGVPVTVRLARALLGDGGSQASEPPNDLGVA